MGGVVAVVVGVASVEGGHRVRPRSLWRHVSNVPCVVSVEIWPAFDIHTFGTLKTCHHKRFTVFCVNAATAYLPPRC